MDQNNETYGVVEARGISSGPPHIHPSVVASAEQLIKEARPEPAVAQAAAPRVLVVDDSGINQKVAVLLLAKLGVKADTAGNGLEALAAIERVPYALVLMDCHMPEMDGLAACRELRRLEGGRRHLPVVAMTASEAGDLKVCLDAGMDAALPKPVRPADLENALRAWTAPVSQDAMRRLSQTTGGDPDLLAVLAAEFEQSGKALTSVIREASAAADRGALALAAHALKGSCLIFGARHLANICSRLESMTEAGQALSCGAFVDALVEEFERVRKALTAGAFRPA